MQQLIKITKQEIGTEFTNSVNSRELYEFLGVNEQYADWIQRAIEKYDFLENEDYICFSEKSEKGGRPRKNYIVTLDMAKELCMVSNTGKGREVRRYFISCEKQLLNQPDLKKILNQLEKQNQEIQNLKNQLSSKEPNLIEKPINPFRGFYDDFAPRERENEFAYTRMDWMLLLSECERVLVEERKNKRQLLISRGGAK